MAKLTSKALRTIFEDSIKESATYKRLDDELKNPCHIIFNGVEYYVYIKNLSYSYLGNPNVTRAQMTGVDSLNEIKESDAMFILLGYDSENEVYATWNPYQVKQRIGTASSPSLYSRLNLQEEIGRTGEIKSMTLNKNLEVLVFPRNRLVDVLSNLDQFFPDTSDYVAMGSKRRSAANAAYKALANAKKLDEYAKFLLKAGVLPSEVQRICQAMKHLFDSNLISLHRKIFLAHDSLADYQSAVVDFFNLDDVIEFKEKWGNLFPAVLSSFIGFLQAPSVSETVEEEGDGEDNETEEEKEKDIPEENSQMQDGAPKDWEKPYEDEHGNLTKLMNPELLKQLRPYLDTEYPSLPPCYNIVGDFYAGRYPKMQLKDWGRLLNNIDWEKCGEDGVIPEEVVTEKQSRLKIKVQFPNGQTSNHNQVMKTLVDVVKYAGAENVRGLNIQVTGDNLITSQLNPLYEKKKAYKDVGGGLFVNTSSNTTKKYEQIVEINEKLGLGLIVEII